MGNLYILIKQTTIYISDQEDHHMSKSVLILCAACKWATFFHLFRKNNKQYQDHIMQQLE